VVSKKHRFKGNNSLRYLYKKGATLRSSTLTVRHLKNNRTPEYRVAVVVSKKVTKSAPKRNRIRRRIYEIIRLNAPKYLQNHDIAIIVYSDKLATIKHQDLEETLIGMLQQIKLVDIK
jgi:ribonuclease P protein component